MAQEEITKKVELAFLLAFYGGMLTEKQREVLSMHCEEDMSLGEIAEELGISRQGVHDNLNRTEALLRNMEAKTGCVSRDLACRKAVKTILHAATELSKSEERSVSTLAQQILAAAQGLEE